MSNFYLTGDSQRVIKVNYKKKKKKDKMLNLM